VQTLDIVRENSNLFEITTLTANRNWQRLAQQAVEFNVDSVVIADSSLYEPLSQALAAYPIKVYAGEEAVAQVAADDNVDVVVNALVGYAGLMPTIAAIKKSKKIALANKETLVVAGQTVMRLAEQYLIRAEAYAEGRGDYTLAGNDIATLREARYQSFGGSVSLTKSDAMTIIEEERIKELYMEGFRLTDLKRWHKGFERHPQSESIENGSSLKIEADDPLFVWPIPQHELESPGSMIEPNESNK
jgi:hypothetical protein